jgi:hypothetical protein
MTPLEPGGCCTPPCTTCASSPPTATNSPDVPEALPRKRLLAERLSSLSEDGQGGAIAARDAAVARVGHRVLEPGPLMGAGLMLLRLRGRGDGAANLRSLLDASGPSLQTVADNVERPTLVSVLQP